MTADRMAETNPFGAQLAWESLPTMDKIEAWERVVPGTAARILDETAQHMRHVRLIAWARLASGLIALAIVAGLSMFYADHNDPTGGTVIFGGATAIIGLFLTNQVLKSGGSRSKINK